MRYPVLCLILMMATGSVMGQNESNKWVFGHNNGLDFNTTPPAFFQTSNISLEGCASVADASGNLLFYSNGNDVWDAGGTIMPNGSGILGNGTAGFAPCSSAQGVAIIHSLANANQYYLFTLDASEQINSFNYPGYLRYSVVDMSLNGGNGDVVSGQKNIMLDTAMTEQMTVVKGAGCYYWLLSHRNNSTLYRAFKIDASGIHPAVASNGVAMGSIGSGQIKVSPDGSRVANGNTYATSQIELGTFNNATGIVSNTFLIDSVAFTVRLGTCFSPDNSKLYISSMNGTLAQYDLAAWPNAAAITATKTLLGNPYQYSQMRNGPDGKIYVAIYQNHPYISVINDPNNAGTACNFVLNGLAQPSWASFAVPGAPYGHGLGNDLVTGVSADTTVSTTTDTLLCAADTFMVAAPSGFNDYLWSDGVTTPSRPLDNDGTYWVYSYQNCSLTVDTFKVRFLRLDINLGPDTAICNNGQLLLDAGNAGDSYLWQDGSTDPTFLVTGKGTYSVTLQKEDCITRDTIVIDTFEPYLDITEEDMTVCNGETVVLHATANPLSTYQWNNGSTVPDITVTEAGTYIVTGTNACGTFTDSVTIAMENCDCRSFIPNAFSPNGDQINDVFRIRTNCASTDFAMSIYNRYGQRIFFSRSPDTGWDGTFNGNAMDTGTYFYYVKFKGPRGDTFERKGDLTLLR